VLREHLSLEVEEFDLALDIPFVAVPVAMLVCVLVCVLVPMLMYVVRAVSLP
jgi:hypothetical protein